LTTVLVWVCVTVLVTVLVCVVATGADAPQPASASATTARVIAARGPSHVAPPGLPMRPWSKRASRRSSTAIAHYLTARCALPLGVDDDLDRRVRSGLQPVTVAAMMQRADLLLRLADQIAFMGTFP
jgi:hypothetical protein